MSLKFLYLFKLLVAVSIINIMSNTAYAADIKILNNQTYHGNEVTDVTDSEIWIAFIPKNGETLAKHVKISVKTVKDYVIDSETTPLTGKEISSQEDALFLLKGLKISDGSIIENYPIKTDPINIDSPVEIKGAKATIKLFGRQNREKYQFILDVSGKTIPLTTPTVPDEQYPQLIWAGDINNDGHPDFVANISTHYNSSQPALFLSAIDKNGVTYNKVAERQSVGC